MELTHSIEENICVVSIGGNLIRETVKEVEKFVASILDDRTIQVLVLNCEKIRFLDSTGMSSLVTVFKTLEQRQGQLILCHLTAKVLQTLKMIDLDKIVKIYATQKEALDSLQQ